MRKTLLAVRLALTIFLVSGGNQAWAQTQAPRPVAPATRQVQIVNGELELGNQKIPVTQGAAIPGLASLNQKMQAALPAYLSTKFKGPTLMVVPASQVRNALGVKTAQTRAVPMATMRVLPAGFDKVMSGYTLYKGTAAGQQSTGVLQPGTGIILNKLPYYVPTPLNENRLSGLQTFLAANTPTAWGTIAPPPQDNLNPNNWLIDLVSVNAFAGPLLASPIGCPPPMPAGSASVSVIATCYSSPPLYVSSPNISIVVPTHMVAMNSVQGWYASNALPLTQISLQVLNTPSIPTQVQSDPDGLSFTSNLAFGEATASSPSQPGATSLNGGQAFTLNVQSEAWNPSQPNPAWMVDFGLMNEYGYTGTGGTLATSGMLAYPYPSATQSNATDTVTFDLQLSQIVTVVRFSFTTSNPYIGTPASIVIPIVVQPLGTIQGKVQPVFIAYEPPGNAATYQYSTIQSGGVAIQSQYQLSSAQSQQSSSSQGLAWTPDLTGTIPGTGGGAGGGGIKVGFTGSVGSTSSNTNLDTQTTTTTTTAGMTNTWTDTTNINGGWPQPPKSTPGQPPIPTPAPAVTTWQANTEYCNGMTPNLIQPSPPDGNAYLCQNNGQSGATIPPSFSALGATTDGTVTWTNVGSAAVFQSPFWEDTLYLEPFPSYAVWEMPGPANGGVLQVSPMPAGGIPWGVTVLQLHLCYEGLYEPYDAAANLTLSPYDCANLLALDPFYLYGQHATLAQANSTLTNPNGTATIAVATQGNGIPPGSGSNVSTTSINHVTAASAVNTAQTGSSTATSVTSVSGSSMSLALSVPGTFYNGNASTGSGQQTGSAISSTFTSSTALTSSVTAGISGLVAVSGNQTAPASGEYIDVRFGSVMFPSVSVNANHLTMTSQGCAGQEVFIDGPGLTGTTTLTFNATDPSAATPSVPIPSFTVASDEEIDVWLPAPGNPSSYATPPVGSYTVTIQGEGFGPVNVPGQFQVTACPGT
jgi:hypothetical protein